MNVQIKVGVTLLPVLLLFSIVAAVSSFAFHDHHSRKIFTGSVGLVVSVGMYGSPLVVMVSHLAFFSSSIFVFGNFKHACSCMPVETNHWLFCSVVSTLYIIAEASNTNKKRGIHAILLIIFFIPGKLSVASLWTTQPWSLYRGLYSNFGKSAH